MQQNDDGGEVTIFESEIRDRDGNCYDISLMQTTLSWQKKSNTTKSSRRQKLNFVSLEEIVAVKIHHKIKKKRKKRGSDDNKNETVQFDNTCLEIMPSIVNREIGNDVNLKFTMEADDNNWGFVVHIARKRSTGSHRWKIYKQIFRGERNLCYRWIQSIESVLSKIPRPKNLLVFINPHGGKRRGLRIYERQVAPLFSLASIRTNVIVTERQHHAKEFLESTDFSSYDGIIGVGGDGMFNEILTGLLISCQKLGGVEVDDDRLTLIRPEIPIGIIPAGSTDGLVYGTVGITDPVTSAVLIILGDVMPIDVTAAHGGNQLLGFSTCILGYGFYGNILSDSERMRWIGPARYNISGTKEWVRHREYNGEVRFLPAGNTACDPRSQGDRCRSHCTVCSDLSPEEDLGSTEESREHLYQTVSGPFLSVHAVTTSCACHTCPQGVSPTAHHGDGFMDLIIVTRCSRLSVLRLLARHMGSGDLFNFRFVKVYRIKEFSLRPLSQISNNNTSHSGGDSSVQLSVGTPDRDIEPQRTNYSPDDDISCWNCDGELIYHPELSAKTHRHLVKLFTKGVDEIKKKSYLSCIP